MRDHISLRCHCGKFQGRISGPLQPGSQRIVCLCDDCQAYAHYLGRAADVLDAQGGTDILPVYPAQLKMTQGAEHLRCLRLSPKGLLRWYAGCCQTPIANTPPQPKMAYAGVTQSILDHAGDGTTADEALGPVRARVQGKFGIRPLAPGTSQSAPLSLLLTISRFLLKGWLKGWGQPSPFFDADGKLRVKPYVLTPAEREDLRKFCGPNPEVRTQKHAASVPKGMS